MNQENLSPFTYESEKEAPVYEVTRDNDLEVFKALHTLAKFAHGKKEEDLIFFLPEANGLLVGVTLIGFGKGIGPLQ